MKIALMVEGQEGLSWEQWVALARAAEDASLDGLFRSDHYRSIVRGEPAGALDAWATLAGLAAITNTTQTRHARLSGHVPPRLRAREARHDRRPHLERPRRARPRRRLVRGRARGVRPRLPTAARAARRARPPARRGHPPVDERRRDPAEAGPATASVAHRRRLRQAENRRAPPSRYADEYNTVWPTVDEARERRRILDDAANAKRTASRSGSR